MQDVIEFFENNFPKDTKFIFPQFDRTENLDFDYIPANPLEFYALVDKAPWNILKGFGFRKWDNMNNIISENKQKPVSNKVSIPIVNAPNETFDVDCGRGDSPIIELAEDEDIILFPHEWYNVIPDGFIVTGLYGESYPFKRGKSDDDKRFGCLPYGIRKPIKFSQKTKPNS